MKMPLKSLLRFGTCGSGLRPLQFSYWEFGLGASLNKAILESRIDTYPAYWSSGSNAGFSDNIGSNGGQLVDCDQLRTCSSSAFTLGLWSLLR